MIINMILWFLLMYGVVNIILDVWKNICCSNIGEENVYITIMFKNDEDTVEDVIRSIVFRNVYMDGFSKILAIDLNSNDKTGVILDNLEKDYECLEVIHTNGETLNNLDKIYGQFDN